MNDLICRFLGPNDTPTSLILMDLRFVNNDHAFGEANSFFSATSLLLGKEYLDTESYEAQLALRALWVKGLARKLIGLGIATIIKVNEDTIKVFSTPDCKEKVEIDLASDKTFLLSLDKAGIVPFVFRTDLEKGSLDMAPSDCKECLFCDSNHFCRQYLYDIPKDENWAPTCPGGIKKSTPGAGGFLW